MLVHGAAGGVGTATIQVAKASGAKVIAVVSNDEKERVAREAGADEVVRSDGPWKDEAKELSGGGVNMVFDPVGGDRFLDSVRSLTDEGRVVVIGFTEGSIPEVAVNRLLLRNVSVVGAGWGAFAIPRPDYARETQEDLDRMAREGFVKPIIGKTYALRRGAAGAEGHRRAPRARQARPRLRVRVGSSTSYSARKGRR